MILNCPSCTMRYLVAEGAIGPNGRTVRCANCSHQWFQEREEGLDEELFAGEAPFGEIPDNFVETMADEDDEIAFEPAKSDAIDLPDARDSDFQSILQRELQEKPIPAGVLPVHEHEEFVLPPKTQKLMPSGDRLAGFATAAGIFLIVFMGFLILHAPISRAWPPSNLIYDLVGMKPVMPGEGLSLESLNAEFKDAKIIFSGSVVNLKDKEADVPSIMVSILDKNEKPIKQILFPPPVSRLKAEGMVEFNGSYPNLPDGAISVSYAFSFLKTKPSHTPDAAEASEEPPGATPAGAPAAPAQETNEEESHEAYH